MQHAGWLAGSAGLRFDRGCGNRAGLPQGIGQVTTASTHLGGGTNSKRKIIIANVRPKPSDPEPAVFLPAREPAHQIVLARFVAPDGGLPWTVP